MTWLLPLLMPTSPLALQEMPPAAAAPAGEIHALLINGGFRADKNYNSHLLHLQEMREALVRRGVDPANIDIFCSDGESQKPDMAVLRAEEDAWLLQDTQAAGLVDITLENTEWDGVDLRPATRSALQAWFATTGADLEPGDTLYLYSTDHGYRDHDNPADSGMHLWKEKLEPDELRAWLAALAPSVEVVMVMSQCYSGVFADSVLPAEGLPDGQSCGFYAVPRDRVAYGCYPEGHLRRVGHGFRFVDALAQQQTLADAHAAVLLSDDSPDVPLATTDLLLERLLAEEAERQGVSFEALVEALLQRTPSESWSDSPVAEISAQYGLPPIDSLADLAPLLTQVYALDGDLEQIEGQWRAFLEMALDENLAGLLQSAPRWEKRLSNLGGLSDPERAALRAELVEALRAQAEASGRWALLEELRARTEEVEDARWRALTREGALERARLALQRIAGEQLLAERGASPEARSYAALASCEDTALGAPAATQLAAAPAPYPALEEEIAAVAALTPARIGMRFKPAGDARPGAVVVSDVEPGSPAADAGLAVGDVVIGEPGAPFALPHQIQLRIATAPAGQPLALEVERGGERLELAVRPTYRPVD